MCYNKIELCGQNLVAIIGLVVNIIVGVYVFTIRENNSSL